MRLRKLRKTVEYDVHLSTKRHTVMLPMRLGRQDKVTLTYNIDIDPRMLRYMSADDFRAYLWDIVHDKALELYDAFEVD